MSFESIMALLSSDEREAIDRYVNDQMRDAYDDGYHDGYNQGFEDGVDQI